MTNDSERTKILGRIRTAQQAVAWVAQRFTTKELRAMGHRSPTAAVLWWWADKEAEDLREYSHRDTMQMLVDGFPRMTLAHVAGRMKALYHRHTDYRSDLEIFFKNRSSVSQGDDNDE